MLKAADNDKSSNVLQPFVRLSEKPKKFPTVQNASKPCMLRSSEETVANTTLEYGKDENFIPFEKFVPIQAFPVLLQKDCDSRDITRNPVTVFQPVQTMPGWSDILTPPASFYPDGFGAANIDAGNSSAMLSHAHLTFQESNQSHNAEAISSNQQCLLQNNHVNQVLQPGKPIKPAKTIKRDRLITAYFKAKEPKRGAPTAVSDKKDSKPPPTDVFTGQTQPYLPQQQKPPSNLQQQAPKKFALRRQLEKALLEVKPPKPFNPEITLLPDATSDFICLVGLEEVVRNIEQLDSEPKKEIPLPPLVCAQCKKDFSPKWKFNCERNEIFCMRCVLTSQKKTLRAKHTARIKNVFVNALQQEKDIDEKSNEQIRNLLTTNFGPAQHVHNSTPQALVESGSSQTDGHQYPVWSWN